jgi:hypothetical protein
MKSGAMMLSEKLLPCICQPLRIVDALLICHAHSPGKNASWDGTLDFLWRIFSFLSFRANRTRTEEVLRSSTDEVLLFPFEYFLSSYIYNKYKYRVRDARVCMRALWGV